MSDTLLVYCLQNPYSLKWSADFFSKQFPKCILSIGFLSGWQSHARETL